MCGIAGIRLLRDAAPAPTRERLVAMAAAIRHRGPDEFGIYRDTRTGLAHARLSIIDLSTGQQPIGNEDGTIHVVFNGEIYNYVELRRELVAMGHVFKTQSDTEVIVHGYEAWGTDVFRRFNGQFAIALWDATKGDLVLARDRVGICPLFYAEHDGKLLFGSEVKSIFAGDPSFPRALDPEGLDETFTFWSTVPPQSIFRGVKELEPAHFRVIDAKGNVRDEAYWTPRYAEPSQGGFRGSMRDAAVAVREALEKATSLRMLRADVPVGSYLSGGLDSSLVAALALRAKGEKFRTFSLRFEDAEYDETEYQRAMVEHIGSDHAEVVVSRADIAKAFPEVIFHTERPILRTAPAPLFLLSKLVHDAGIKVVLTGEGADEMFAGYDLFREGKVRRFWAKAPESKSRPRLLERLYPYLARSPVAQQAMARQFFGRNLAGWKKPGFGHDMRWHTTGALKRLFHADVRKSLEGFDGVGRFLATLPADFREWSTLAQDQAIEIRALLAGYLLSSQGDRMLLGHAVEGRFPFLDSEVIELANSLPHAYKLHVLDEKHVLKRASDDVVPAKILARPKQPYRAPDALSFFGASTPEWLEDVTSEKHVEETGVFDPKAVRALVTKGKASLAKDSDKNFSNADNMAIVGILSTEWLAEHFLRKSPEVPDVPIRTLIDRVTG